MQCFETRILRFGEQGEKTGWTYIEVPVDCTDALCPRVKKSFRVKGFLDKHTIKGVALIPIGAGQYILPINATMRKALAKSEGATIKVQLVLDKEEYVQHALMLECLQEAPIAQDAFNKMPRSHQNYYSKWIESAKTMVTQEKRIVMMISALERGLDYGAMLREQTAINKLR